MKKLAIAVVGITGLVLTIGLCVSFWVGRQLEQTFVHTVQSWGEDSRLTIQVLDYDAGVIRSHASTLWSFVAEDSSYDIVVSHQMLHGPWSSGQAAHIQSFFYLPEDSEPELIAALDGQAVLALDSWVSWSQASHHHLTSPSFSVTFADASSLSWGGLQSSWQLSSDQESIEGRLLAPLLRVRIEDGSLLETENAGLQLDVRVAQDSPIWEGVVQLQLAHAAVQDAASVTQLGLKHLRLTQRNQRDEALANLDFEGQLASLEIEQHHSRNWQLQAHAHRVDVQWLDALLTWLQAGDDAVMAADHVLAQLPLLLRNDPALSLTKLRVDTEDGPASAQAELSYSGAFSEPFLSLQQLKGHLKVDLPRSTLRYFIQGRVEADYLELLESMGQDMDEQHFAQAVSQGVDKRLATLLEHHAFEANDARLSSELLLRDGALHLNHQATDWESLLNLAETL